MAVSQKGIDVRQAGPITFRALLQDAAGALVTAGSTSLYIYEIQNDATLRSFDFGDMTFKTTALTTETTGLAHRSGNNGTTATGVWAGTINNVSGFTFGAIYLARIRNTGASPVDQYREFQWGGEQGDLVVAANGDITGNRIGNVTGSVGSVAGNVLGSVASVAGNVAGNVVGSVGSVLVFSAGAIQSIWDALSTAMLTANSMGKRIVDFLTGDAFNRLGAPSGASVSADILSLLTRLSAARAGYLDNLNIGGPVASHADILAINQSSSRHVILTTVMQYERPEAGNSTYTVEARTYDATGAAVNADTTPTLTATGALSGSLNANLSAPVTPAVGVYRWTYTVAAAATVEQVRFDVAATITASIFTLSSYTQVVDEVAATFTTTDKANLTAIAAKLPTKPYLTGTGNVTGDVQLDGATGNYPGSVGSVAGNVGGNINGDLNGDVKGGVAGNVHGDVLGSVDHVVNEAFSVTDGDNLTAIFNKLLGITSLAKWLQATLRKDPADGTAIAEIDAGGGTYVPSLHSQQAISGEVIGGGGGGGGGGSSAGPGATACVLHFADESNAPIADADVWLTSDPGGATTIAGTHQTDSNGNVSFMLDLGNVYYVWLQKDGIEPIRGAAYTAVV